jgi:acyl phosphate:glycerol-3-phosphate acyltransferase
MLQTLLLFTAAYLMGSIPFGVLISKKEDVAITEHGSGNIGATNVFRTVGKKAGLLTLLGDFFKGLLPVLIAFFLTKSVIITGIAGVLTVFGHMFSLFLKFKGGKGVATSLGVFIGMMPYAALSAIAVWLILCYVTRYVSFASMVASLSVPLFAGLFDAPKFYIIASALIAAFIVFKHKDNLKKLLAGEESKFSWSKK